MVVKHVSCWLSVGNAIDQDHEVTVAGVVSLARQARRGLGLCHHRILLRAQLGPPRGIGVEAGSPARCNHPRIEILQTGRCDIG